MTGCVHTDVMPTHQLMQRIAGIIGASVLAAWSVVAVSSDTTAVVPAQGWRFSVFAQDIMKVDNLALGADGLVYATLELSAGKGKVVRLRNTGSEVVVDGLDTPDGLFARDKFLYAVEEVNHGRVLEIDTATGKHRTLARLYRPEGIGILPNGDLALSEDSANGRLVRLSSDGQIETILGGLNRPEGLCVGKDGTIFFAETGTGRVQAFKDGNVRNLAVDLDYPDQVRLPPHGAPWITEDSPRGRLMRLKDGGLHVILSGLYLPQGMLFLPNGTLLLAEQGRGRILVVTRDEPAP